MNEGSTCHKCGQPATVQLKNGDWACDLHGIEKAQQRVDPKNLPAEVFRRNRESPPIVITAEMLLRTAVANLRTEGVEVNEQHIAAACERMRQRDNQKP